MIRRRMNRKKDEELKKRGNFWNEPEGEGE